MAPKDGVQPPASTPGEEISVDTAFKDLERAIETTDPYGGPTLPGTPARSSNSGSILSLPSNRESRPGEGPTEQRKKAFRSDSMQQLWCRIEDQSARAVLQSREQRASWFSQLTFHWASRLIWTGYRRPLLSNDIPLIRPDRQSQGLAVAVQEAFQRKCKSGNNSALRSALFSEFKREFVIGGICRGLADVLLVLTPYTLRYLIKFADDSYVAGRKHTKGPPVWQGITYLAAVIIMLSVQTLAHNYYWYLLGVIGGESRAVLTAAIFDKAMRVEGRGRAATVKSQQPGTNVQADHGSKDLNDSSTGHLTNLLSVDCARVAQGAPRIHFLWTAPLSIILAITLLIVNLHTAALAGFALLFIGFIVLMAAVRVLFGKRKAIDKVTEARVSLTEEALNGIRFLKYHGWAERFVKRILDLRGRETRQLQRYTAVRTAVGSISQSLPALTATLAFITYALTDSALSPAIVFSSSALFVSLRTPLIFLPTALQGCSDSAAALRRIQKYLLTEEIEDYPLQSELEPAAEVRRATFAWDLSEYEDPTEKQNDTNVVALPTGEMARSKFQLKQIDLTIRRGELLAVIGSVGSGKSSLISALAGDMTKVYGDVAWGASYATCPQQPWIYNATVRENITFGSTFPFSVSWYNTVLQACSLSRDLDLLQHGDKTVLGERGIVLSGGQKQRISLARAMYSEKDVVLLDDPLSAVDANVGRAILDYAICGQMANRTRVLCTHDMQMLHRCDRILWMEQGRVRALGTYQDLIRNSPGFSGLLRDSEDINEDDERKAQRPPGVKQSGPQESAGEGEVHQDGADSSIQSEKQVIKSVSWSVYGALFGPLSRVLLIIFGLPTLLVGSASMVLTQLWLAWWSQLRFDLQRNTYIGIYVALAVAQVLGLFLFGLIVGLHCNHSGRVLHNKAVQRLVHAPIWFFDTTPLGRHIDRISSDIEAIDYHLPEALRMLFVSTFGLASMFALIIAYFHWFGIAVGALVLMLVSLAIFCRATAREVKRHESVLRSVVFSRFMEGLSGISTLRTYSMESNFLHKIFNAADDTNSATFTLLAVQRWLGLRQDAATIALVLVMGVLVIVDRHSQEPAISGLVLSLMLANVQVIQVVVREWSDVESAMNSTERLHAYASTLPQEPDDASILPAKEWPQRGEVHFLETRMRYRPGLPEALKGVDLHVRGGEHVAIVGRTGAGKSSIVNSLFRLSEVSGGAISIDGSNIAQVPLQDLRGGALSIIPQESLLFSGTVRSNLDPFGEHTDESIWHALRTAGLDRTLYPSDAVHGQGSNMSLGERQLLALARALMRDTRILVCDEATAALDAETDEYIQRVMHRAFRDRTVLCIAHRLRTVLWYDRICVMDAGHVAELGTPLELFRTQDGIFRQMCMGLGITEEQICSAAAMGDEVEKAPLVKLKMRDDKAGQKEQEPQKDETRAPEIQMKFPSPSMDLDLHSVAAVEGDFVVPTIEVPEIIEPVVRPRQRSRPGRRFTPSSIYSLSIASWAESQRTSIGLENFF